jgi:hypothetical protein
MVTSCSSLASQYPEGLALNELNIDQIDISSSVPESKRQDLVSNNQHLLNASSCRETKWIMKTMQRPITHLDRLEKLGGRVGQNTWPPEKGKGGGRVVEYANIANMR